MILPSRRQTSVCVSLVVCIQVPVVHWSVEPTDGVPTILGAFDEPEAHPPVEPELVAVASDPVVACSVTRQAIFLPTSAFAIL